MKKLLTALLILFCAAGYSQTIQSLGGPSTRIEIKGQSITDSIFWPTIRDTTFTPPFEGAITFKTSDKSFYGYKSGRWQPLGGGIWGSITGTLTSQIDLYDTLLNRQFALSNAYGIKIIGHNAVFDSAGVRKVDSIWRTPGVDSFYYAINGHTYAILDSIGSASGSGLTGGGNLPPLFTTSVSGTTLNFAQTTQASNLVFAGPASGSAANPTFRTLTVPDLPSGIPNSYLTNSNINFSLGTTGTDASWNLSSVNLGGTAILNLPSSSATNRGLLTSADWSTFNSKVTSVNGLFGVVVTKSADSIKKLPVDTTSNRDGYVLTFDSLNHKWYLSAPPGGGGTTYSAGALDGNGASSNGFSISGSSIYMQSASASAPGVVNNTTQGFSGNKSWGGSFALTGLSNKTPTSTDSALLRDASTGKLWTYSLGLYVNKTTDSSAYHTMGFYDGRYSPIGSVKSVSGTANRITSTGGATPVIDISSTFEALLGKVANPLSQFAATTSAQLAGVISDETGTGKLVFATSPLLTTPRLSSTSTINYVWTATDALGNGSWQPSAGGGGSADSSVFVTITALNDTLNSHFTYYASDLSVSNDSVYGGGTLLRDRHSSGSNLYNFYFDSTKIYATGSAFTTIQSLDTTGRKQLVWNTSTHQFETMHWQVPVGVTSFSAGALSPIFTTSVATATTTPALTFALSTATAHAILGNNTAGTAAPTYFVPTSTTLNGWFGGTIQGALTLTTTGTSGAATLIGNTLNIPQYSGGGGSGGIGIDSVQTYTSGATLTQTAGYNYIQLNPSTTQAALTITTATVWHTSNDLYIVAGGTITSGTVITNLTIAAGAGLTIVDDIPPTTIQVGHPLHYHKIGSLVYRIKD